MERIAILDLGTNTFNLLIAEVKPNSDYTILISEKRPVKLGEGRINEGEIIPAAIQRGLDAISGYTKTIKKHAVEKIRAFGTSAFRTAANGPAFLSEIENRTGVSVEIISGDKEAELIYYGVKQTLLLNDHIFLILDIGGGSNEFILADMDKIYWKKSYPLGIARLLERFLPSDPLIESEVSEITHYIEEELTELFEVVKNMKVNTLVGASGSFETFAHMIEESDVVETEGQKDAVSTELPLDKFDALHQRLLFSSIADRKEMKGLEPMRIEMIVLASLFVKILLDKLPLTKMYQSNFALKEGAVLELIANK